MREIGLFYYISLKDIGNVQNIKEQWFTTSPIGTCYEKVCTHAERLDRDQIRKKNPGHSW